MTAPEENWGPLQTGETKKVYEVWAGGRCATYGQVAYHEHGVRCTKPIEKSIPEIESAFYSYGSGVVVFTKRIPVPAKKVLV